MLKIYKMRALILEWPYEMFQELCFFLDYYNYDFLHPVNKFQCSWCIGNKTAFLSQQQQQITWASGCNRATWDSSCNNLLETTDATVYLRQQLQQKFDTAADTVYLRLPLNQLNREGSCTVYLRHRSYNRLRKTAAAQLTRDSSCSAGQKNNTQSEHLAWRI